MNTAQPAPKPDGSTLLARTFVRGRSMTLSRAHILLMQPAHPGFGTYRTRCGRFLPAATALLVRLDATPRSEICETCRTLIS